MKDYVSILQGFYYLLTGLWAIAGIRTFQMVTGPKTDLWLVKTVGAVLISAGLRSSVTFEIFTLAVGSCPALAAVDIIYAGKKVISEIYLPDAALEANFYRGLVFSLDRRAFLKFFVTYETK
jgi:hypothetical protein